MGQKQCHFRGQASLKIQQYEQSRWNLFILSKQDNYFSYAKFTGRGLTRLASLLLAVRTDKVATAHNTAPKESNNDYFHP